MSDEPVGDLLPHSEKKKARLSEEEDIFAASVVEVQQQIVEWESWRQKFGVRKPSNTTIERHPWRLPRVCQQQMWHYYTDETGQSLMSWVMTPFLIPGVIPPLAGADKKANLFQCTV